MGHYSSCHNLHNVPIFVAQLLPWDFLYSEDGASTIIWNVGWHIIHQDLLNVHHCCENLKPCNNYYITVEGRGVYFSCLVCAMCCALVIFSWCFHLNICSGIMMDLFHKMRKFVFIPKSINKITEHNTGIPLRIIIPEFYQSIASILPQ
jgi:hypothetical protein